MSIKKDFSLMAILLMPVAVAINIVGGQLINLLKLPVYLDAIGTILIACIAGPWVGALTGILSNAINAIFAPQLFPYAFVSMCIAIAVGFLAKRGMFTTFGRTIISALVVVVVAIITSLPITVYVFGGASGGGTSLVTSALLAMGNNLIQAVLTTSLLSELADKILSCIIAYFIIKGMSARYLSKFSLGEQYINNNHSQKKNISL
ncbi:ECF transporter S component [Lederbergia citrea]|uniref:ECF transporter S component n=1 Tax=Lederbergia citrea TaxID=2833581 RepID=A0A942UVN0_9BACI|nr:ECF transporter S component [Lederbergia citrea]MBS4177793.1 ECF transporter S component [Lederbergia citrea]MBS4204466.1 ECF transporter S component [Lederbergia citrea]MBS4223689.1 ECF transporter S component [Lederbergia citrea]